MRATHGLIASVFLLSGASAMAADIPTVQIPDQYLTGQAPANLGLDHAAAVAAVAEKKQAAATIEHAQALNGTLYAVVSPTYNGITQSFFRFFNGAAASSTFSLTLVGSPSGRTYGSGNLIVPRNASLQKSLGEVITLTGSAALNGGDTSYALYIQNAEPTAGYEHVTYNDANKFFENASICKTTLNEAIASVSASQVLINVHTSLIPTYPSAVQIHNYWNAAVTYRFSVIDAVTGTVKGSANVITAANASYEMPFSFFETSVGWTPTGTNERHANLIVTDVSGAPPYEVLGQSIQNSTLSANINMTTACAVNAVANSGGVVGGGLNGY